LFFHYKTYCVRVNDYLTLCLEEFMDIKEKIAARITKARKEMGITIKELAARTGTLSAARISNWEQGTRKPDPSSAKLMADILNVSASYLLCLTDNPHGELSLKSGNTSRFIPVLSMDDSPRANEILNTHNENAPLFDGDKKSIVLDGFSALPASSNLFAVVLDDNSMQPDLTQGDLIIINADRKPCPGDFVLAHLYEKKQTVLRKYGEMESCLFQLLASNPLWATINVKNIDEVLIIGVVTEYRRYL